jgi:hypothetical protein
MKQDIIVYWEDNVGRSKRGKIIDATKDSVLVEGPTGESDWVDNELLTTVCLQRVGSTGKYRSRRHA